MTLPVRLQYTNRYAERYAIAVIDGDDRFVLFIITRSNNGDVYMNWPHQPDIKTHTSYHSSGQLHTKSSNKVIFKYTKQRPNSSFKGAVSLPSTSIHRGEGKAIGITLDKSDFIDVMEIPEINIDAKNGTLLDVELVEQNQQPNVFSNPGARIIQQHSFTYSKPEIVVTLCYYMVQ